nr:Mfa1 family fimbria major subunit [uncultured Prevotella sp.]
MKKLKSVFLLGALAIGLGLTSCSSDDTLSSSTAEEKGNTYVAVSLTMPLSSGTRATSTSTSSTDYNLIGEWVGKDEIQSVAIYIVGDGVVSTGQFVAGDFTIANATNAITLTPKKAIKTTPGDKQVYVLINGTQPMIDALATADPTNFVAAYKSTILKLKNSGSSTIAPATSASQLIGTPTTPGDDVIAITNSEDASVTVVKDITSAEALDPTDPQNRAKVKVQRAVGRVMVTTEKNTYPIKSSTGTVLGTVSNITWVLAQGENSLYVQQKSDFTTPNSSWIPASTGTDVDYNTNAGNKYDYSGLFESYEAAPGFGGTAVPTMDAYKDPTAAGIGDSSVLNGKFILPTTHTPGDATSTDYRKGNTAYVLVRAKYAPATYADTGTGTGNSDGTFYLGANGKYYTTAANAVNPAKGGITGQTVAKYVGGKVLYYAWVNPDKVPGWLNSPVLRNNIYHIHITGFNTIGTNWNPLYPEDPTTANPSNPDPKPKADSTDPDYNPKNEPTNPIDPTDPLTTPETWMSVDVTVLPWTVHSYGVNLGI